MLILSVLLYEGRNKVSLAPLWLLAQFPKEDNSASILVSLLYSILFSVHMAGSRVTHSTSQVARAEGIGLVFLKRATNFIIMMVVVLKKVESHL